MINKTAFETHNGCYYIHLLKVLINFDVKILLEFYC